MTANLRSQVLDMYADVDREVAAAGPVCAASGRCCRFKEYGHVLYLSALEAEVLLHSAPPYERPASPDFCPFQEGGLCTARGPRPLGCRVYYCDPAYQETGSAITEKHLHRLKAMPGQDGQPWRQPVGEGHGSPVVADGKVFLHTKVKDKEAEEVAAYDAASGKRLWAKQYDRGPLHEKFIRQFGVGPRSTPAYRRGRLYTLGVT